MPDVERLFSTVKIGSLELKNRFIRSATWEGMATEDGSLTEPLLEIYRKLAEGGVGLILTGYAYVNIRGKANPGMLAVDSDDTVESLKSLADTVHESGGLVALQIAHGGSQSKFDTGYGTEAPSAVKERAFGTMPTPMSRDDIKRTISDFASAARRAKEAGFDAVEIHAAHGYLLAQFLSPYSNQRSDAYGGPIKKRARIVFDVYKAVRKEVGPDFPVMIKINSEDFVEVGFTAEECRWVCSELSKMGIDAIELSGGIPAAGDMAPARENIVTQEREAYFQKYAKEVRKEIDCPLILVGGVRSLEVMDELLENGTADLFSMARPFISEPALINRWLSGDISRARCISCNQCFNAIREEGRVYCVAFSS